MRLSWLRSQLKIVSKVTLSHEMASFKWDEPTAALECF